MKKFIQNTYSFSSICHDNIFTDGDWVESKDQDQNGQVRLLQLADIGTGQFLDKSKRYMSLKKAKELKCTFIKNGDILIARMPDPIGRACLFKRNGLYVTVVDICILRPNLDIVHPRWLLWFINSKKFLNQIKCYISGTTRKRISRKNLDKIQFEIPPLPEQKRIADILDKADNLKKMRQESIKKLDELSQSIFLDMFGDPVKNPKKWILKKFGEAGALDRGKSKHRPRNDPSLLGGPYPLIQTGDVSKSKGYLETFNHTYSEFGLKQSKIWPKGTLCITIAANIAKTAILYIDACFPDSVVGFTPNSSFTTEYVRCWMTFLQKILEETAPVSAQKNINLQILKNLDIPAPPIALQKDFSEKIHQIRKIRNNISNSDQELQNLFNALMQKAFKGELNTQEQLDEGAVLCQTSHSSSQTSQESSMMH